MKYDEMSVQSLQTECRKLGIATVPRKKAELIELLIRNQKPSSEENLHGDNCAEAYDESRACSNMSRESRVSESMTEDEKVAARRKRFGVPAGHSSSSKDNFAAAESISEDERIKIEQRRRRFNTNG